MTTTDRFKTALKKAGMVNIDNYADITHWVDDGDTIDFSTGDDAYIIPLEAISNGKFVGDTFVCDDNIGQRTVFKFYKIEQFAP